MRNAIIPLFIPHDGCPYRCTFCNQWRITGETHSVTPAQVAETIAAYRASTNRERHWEVAFYGGSFTALSRSRMRALLAPATAARQAGEIASIRVSTRPDAISDEIVGELYTAGVRTVELGVQSMDDNVLRQAKRGHTAAQVADAVRILRAYGMTVGLQLLPGLKGDTRRTLARTLRRAAALAPDAVRIYPVLVMADTELAQDYARGSYRPLTEDEAILITAWWRTYLLRRGIAVIRMGLQATAALDAGDGVVAGPYHPAFGELVLSRICEQRLRHALRRATGRVIVTLSPRDASRVYGRRRENRQRLERSYPNGLVWHIDAAQPQGIVRLRDAHGERDISLATDLR